MDNHLFVWILGPAVDSHRGGPHFVPLVTTVGSECVESHDLDGCWFGAEHGKMTRSVTHLSIEGIILEILAHDQGKHGSDQYIGTAQPPRQASKSREGETLRDNDAPRISHGYEGTETHLRIRTNESC